MTSGIDSSELRALAREIRTAPARKKRSIPPLVKRGAVNIKRQLRAEMGASRHFKQVVPLIDFDLKGVNLFGSDLIEAEIGPRSEGAGSLANIAYFGGANGGGGRVPDPQGALDAEAPRFESALSDLLGDL